MSRRPVIFAGAGCLGNREGFAAKVTELGIPVLLTWKAADLLEDDHPLYFGRPGGIGQRWANFILQNADLVLILGVRLDPDAIGFRYDQFAPRARKIVCDIDPAEIDKLPFEKEIEVTDLTANIQQLNIEWERNDEWLAYCREMRAKYEDEPAPSYPGKVSMYAFQRALSEMCQEGEVIVPGSSGPCANTMMQVWKVKRGQRFYFAPALGAMGSGLPMAIGAALATGKRVVSVIGDGGFSVNIQDLATVKRLDLPIKYFVLDNGCYGSICAMQRASFGGHYVAANAESGLRLPNLQGIAWGYDLPSIRIRDETDMVRKMELSLSIKGPTITAVTVDPAEEQIWRLRSVGGVNPPLEDLWPLLPREELAANMRWG